MGHHLFSHDRKLLPMRDFDVALVRHFLIEGAKRLGDEFLAKAIVQWGYQGPGVWTGIDEAVLADHRRVFAAGIDIAETLGDQIPLDYLNDHARLPDGRWLKEQTTSEVVARIRSLEEHFHGRT